MLLTDLYRFAVSVPAGGLDQTATLRAMAYMVQCYCLVCIFVSRSASGTLTPNVRLGLCLTNNFAVFCALSFVSCFTTVTPQIMLPLVGDLAPPNRRATALSIVVSGLILGMLIARLLSGIVANYIGLLSPHYCPRCIC